MCRIDVDPRLEEIKIVAVREGSSREFVLQTFTLQMKYINEEKSTYDMAGFVEKVGASGTKECITAVVGRGYRVENNPSPTRSRNRI